MGKYSLKEKVYQITITMRATLVLNYLIDRANKDSLACFPGVKTIARECNVSERTVQRAIKDLVDAGYINKEYRYRKDNSHTSNLYTLVLEKLEDAAPQREKQITIKDYEKGAAIEVSNEVLEEISVEQIDFASFVNIPEVEEQVVEEQVEESAQEQVAVPNIVVETHGALVEVENKVASVQVNKTVAYCICYTLNMYFSRWIQKRMSYISVLCRLIIKYPVGSGNVDHVQVGYNYLSSARIIYTQRNFLIPYILSRGGDNLTDQEHYI